MDRFPVKLNSALKARHGNRLTDLSSLEVFDLYTCIKSLNIFFLFFKKNDKRLSLHALGVLSKSGSCGKTKRINRANQFE